MYGRVGACKPADADADTETPEREAVADAGRADADAGRADAGRTRAGERERVKDGSYPNDADAPGAWSEVDDGAMETPLFEEWREAVWKFQEPFESIGGVALTTNHMVIIELVKQDL